MLLKLCLMLMFFHSIMLADCHTWRSSKPYENSKVQDFIHHIDEEQYGQQEITQREQFEYCYAQGNIFYKKKNYHEALFWLFKAFEVAPKNIIVLLRITDIYLEQQQIDLAIAFLENALQEDPKNLHLLEKLSKIYLDNGRKEKGYYFCEKAAELNSSDWEIYAKLITRDFPDKINEQTLSLSLHSMELYPDKISPYYNTGLILEYLNRPEEAIPYFKKALEIDPSHEPSHRVLSKSYFKTGKFLKPGGINNGELVFDLRRIYVSKILKTNA